MPQSWHPRRRFRRPGFTWNAFKGAARAEPSAVSPDVRCGPSGPSLTRRSASLSPSRLRSRLYAVESAQGSALAGEMVERRPACRRTLEERCGVSLPSDETFAAGWPDWRLVLGIRGSLGEGCCEGRSGRPDARVRDVRVGLRGLRSLHVRGASPSRLRLLP